MGQVAKNLMESAKIANNETGDKKINGKCQKKIEKQAKIGNMRTLTL